MTALRSSCGVRGGLQGGSRTPTWPGVSAPPALISQAYRPLLVRLDRRARADQVTVPVRVVDAPHERPELVGAHPGRGERGLLAAIRVRPLVRGQLARRVRGVLERVVPAGGGALLDGADLLADREQGVTEPVA